MTVQVGAALWVLEQSWRAGMETGGVMGCEHSSSSPTQLQSAATASARAAFPPCAPLRNKGIIPREPVPTALPTRRCLRVSLCIYFTCAHTDVLHLGGDELCPFWTFSFFFLLFFSPPHSECGGSFKFIYFFSPQSSIYLFHLNCKQD